jgi:ribosomal protein S18 acetylase RimI-like enzyme
VANSEEDLGHSRLLLRAGTVADAERIEAVHWSALEAAYLGRVQGWPETPRDTGERVNRWRDWLLASDIDVIVGEVDSEIVGFCTVRPAAANDLDPVTDGEIPTLYVHPEHWSRGYGRSLCSEALRSARDRGFVSVFLWVVDLNERARDFYLSLGFTPDGGTKLEAHAVEPYTASRYRISLEGAHRAAVMPHP